FFLPLPRPSCSRGTSLRTRQRLTTGYGRGEGAGGGWEPRPPTHGALRGEAGAARSGWPRTATTAARGAWRRAHSYARPAGVAWSQPVYDGRREERFGVDIGFRWGEW